MLEQSGMTSQVLVFEIAKLVIVDAIPEEEAVLETFRVQFAENPEQWQQWTQQVATSGQGEVGFGLGEMVTFLTPWVVLAIEKSLPMVQDIMKEIIKERIKKWADQKQTVNLPLVPGDIPPKLLRQLESHIETVLKSKRLGGSNRKKIVKAVVRAVLFDQRSASIVSELIKRD